MTAALTDNTVEAETTFPVAYGPYSLLHKLARGGMGDVFLAKMAGTMGIDKHCVVKTLRASFTHDPEYVQRFMEEARVVVQLSHRNICPVFDVGRIGGSYYLAMELVIGRDVRSLQVALDHLGRRMSEACALHVVCEALDALDYAHRSVDATTGEPLHLVHRDVSPQNVLINNEGEVKLIDFGLAERRGGGVVVGRSDDEPNTTATTVMGKMSYMAPEQARGEVVDARADQFAAAILAYELVTHERYYQGLTSQQVWQQAGAGEFRPAGMRALHPLLRKVIEKALSPHKEDRYASCGDLRDALLEYMRDRELHSGDKELRATAQELFAEDLQETRALLRRFPSVAPAHPEGRRAPDDVLSFASAPAETIHDPTQTYQRSTGLFAKPDAPRSRAPLLAAVLGVVAVVAIVGLVLALSRQPQLVAAAPEAPPPAATTPVVAPPPPPAEVAPPAAPPAALPATAVEEVEKVEAAPTARPRKRATASARKPSGAPLVVPFSQKFAAMKKCKDPCAPRYLVWEDRINEIPLAQLKVTTQLIDKCYERCKAR